MRSRFTAYRDMTMRMASLLYLLLIVPFSYVVNDKASNSFKWMPAAVWIGFAIVVLTVAMSFFYRFYDIFNIANRAALWCVTLFLMGEVIYTGFFGLKTFILFLMIMVCNSTLFTLRAYYIWTVIQFGVLLLVMFLASAQIGSSLQVLGILIVISFVSLINVYYRESMNASYLKSFSRHRQLLDNTNEAYALHELIFDKEGNAIDYEYVDVNAAFTEMTGLTAGNVIGKGIYDILPETESYWIDTYAAVVKNRERCVFINYSESIGRYYKVCAYPEEGNRFVTLFVDVTEKLASDRAYNAAQRNAQKTSESKNQFLRDVNHKLRTPLNGMMGLMQLIDKTDLSDEYLELMEGIEYEMRRSRNILNQIAEYIKVQDLEYVITQNDLDKHILEIIEQVHRDHGILMRLMPGESSMHQLNYENMVFDRVLRALLINACVHSKSERVEVVTSKIESESEGVAYYNISVIDYGIGISQEHQTHIFNELHHHDFVNLEREEHQIGLPICKMMMHQVGGDLTLKSSVGKGSEFIMKLPVFEKIG